jgi:flagellar protein FlaG
MNNINAVNAAVQQYGDGTYARQAQAVSSAADDSAAAQGQTQQVASESSDKAGSWADALSKAQEKQAAEAVQQNGEEAEQASDAELEKQREEARELTEKLNAQNIGLNFDVDDTYDRMVIKVTNRSTNDLVRQIPSEDLMRFQKVIADFESSGEEDSSSTQSYGSAGSAAEESLASAIKGLIFDTRA